ncbi:MAG: ribonuclease HII [Candidatus Woesearchaeota archaeon]
MIEISKMICGVDEAGRGPILGPLVMAGMLIKEGDENRLKALGVKDSKLLTKEKREELFEQIKELAVSYKIIAVSPAEIDAALNDPNLNLNWLEADTSAEIVNELKPNQVILDCPSTNPPAYKNYFINKLAAELREEAEVIAEHKADLNYVVVGAASILAKVTRDREIEKIKKQFGECGSGYLADEKTQIFFKENFEKHAHLFRKTWKPYQDLIKSKGQKSLGDW